MAEKRWPSLGENVWPILGENTWPIIVRKMTLHAAQQHRMIPGQPLSPHVPNEAPRVLPALLNAGIPRFRPTALSTR